MGKSNSLVNDPSSDALVPKTVDPSIKSSAMLSMKSPRMKTPSLTPSSKLGRGKATMKRMTGK